MAVQSSWNLDSTADSLIGISRNGLAAATTDDVQPIALLACEKFGATLAMSQETIRKIQVSVMPTPSPAFLNFLKVSVGYKANDCVNYFGENTAGLHFLGLACALVTFSDQYEAAIALQIMLESSTDDKRLLPTARQLHKLLAALGPRCHQSGFTDEIVGWNLLLKQELQLKRQRNPLRAQLTVPRGEAINSVIDALRQLNRVGNADITSIVIKTADYAAWFAGFVKWSTGYPPSVVCTDGSSIIQQPASKVTIRIPIDDEETPSSAVSVTIYSSVNRPSELISPSAPIFATGMIRLPTYGRAILQHLCPMSDVARAAFLEAMPSALSIIIHLVQTKVIQLFANVLDVPRAVDDAMPLKSTAQSSTDGVRATPLCPFPEPSAISRIFTILFDMQIDTLPNLEWVDIFALQHVALYLGQCSCSSNCAKGNSSYSLDCLKRSFTNMLGQVIIDVLALSLVNNPDDILVSNLPPNIHRSRPNLLHIIQVALCAEGTLPNIEALDFAQRALDLLGHRWADDTDTVQDQVLSSFCGQVVWPTVYETLAHSKHGYLCFSWHPGRILYKDETFEDVTWFKHGIHTTTLFPSRIEGTTVAGPCNLYSDVRVKWDVAVQLDQLHTQIVLVNKKALRMRVGFGQRVRSKLEMVILVEQCPHSRDALLHSPDTTLAFTDPVNPLNGSPGNICIVAVDNDVHLEFIAIHKFCENEPIMVRGGACINCCVEQCRRFGSRVLVL